MKVLDLLHDRKKKILKPFHLFVKKYNCKTIRSRNFSIISNNCWGGYVYKYFNMQFLTPTIGLYLFPDDYLKFISRLKYYLSLELVFISADESKFKDELYNRNHIQVPIGVLDDIEIIFLHYKTEYEAEEKWNRRKTRINWDNLYFKFSKMNGCTENHMEIFSKMPYKNKILLSNRKKTKYSCEYYFKGVSENNQLIVDTSPFPGSINLRKIFRQEFL